MRVNIFFLTALLLVAATAASFWAQGITELTAEEVKKRLEQPEKVLIVDARTTREYVRGHLPTAINIPPSQFNVLPKLLPPRKDLPIIFYCRGYS